MNTVTPIVEPSHSASQPAPDPRLREAVDRVVGNFFFGTLLRAMRNSVLKGEYGHGGRGEDIFQAQLDQLLSERAGLASNFNLSDAVLKRFDRRGQAELLRSTGDSFQSHVEPRNG